MDSLSSLLITEVDSTRACRVSSIDGSNFCGVLESFINDENFGPAWSSSSRKTGFMAGGDGTWLRLWAFSLLSENRVSVARIGKDGIFRRGLIGVLS